MEVGFGMSIQNSHKTQLRPLNSKSHLPNSNGKRNKRGHMSWINSKNSKNQPKNYFFGTVGRCTLPEKSKPIGQFMGNYIVYQKSFYSEPKKRVNFHISPLIINVKC